MLYLQSIVDKAFSRKPKKGQEKYPKKFYVGPIPHYSDRARITDDLNDYTQLGTDVDVAVYELTGYVTVSNKTVIKDMPK